MVGKTPVANEALAEVLDRFAAVGHLWAKEEGDIRCYACGHRCLIGEGKRGICKVRSNHHGELLVPWGYTAGVAVDPIEKKPYFHVYPGSDALTFGMLGCDLHCSYCQNWFTSQSLRDYFAQALPQAATPAEIVAKAVREGAKVVVSSYNEPLITAEWAVAIFHEAMQAGLTCGFVSNGNATPEVLDYLRPWIRMYKVDLKSFDDRHYRTLGCTLETVTNTIRMLHERKLWIEIVTLVIPGFNDNEAELRAAAEFLASVDRDIPWHLTAFHEDYKMRGNGNTSAATLMRAAQIGVEAGLRFVYVGNLPGQVGGWENTRCPSCQLTLIDRFGYLVRAYQITGEGTCPRCQCAIPGIWPSDPQAVRTGDLTMLGSRIPRRV